MTQSKSTAEKNPNKVKAGQKGGLAKAENLRTGTTSTRSPKRKAASQRAESSASQHAESSDDRNPAKRSKGLAEKSAEATPPTPVPDASMGVQPSKKLVHLVTAKEHPLPVTIRTANGKVYQIRARENTADEDQSFWVMLERMAHDLKMEAGPEAYGAVADHAQSHLHLDLAAHLHPQLLSATRQLRYTKASPGQSIVTKKSYREFLEAIQASATRLLASSKSDLAERTTSLSTNEFTRKLLAIEPRAPGVIPDHVHKTQLGEHEQNLAHSAEIIRQELVGVGSLASSYVEKARQATGTLCAVYLWLRKLLDPNNVDSTERNIREEETTDSKSAAVADSVATANSAASGATAVVDSAATTASHASNPFTLPDVVIREVLEAHECLCPRCRPDIKQQLHEEAKSEVLNKDEARIRGKAREALVMEVRKEHLPLIRDEVKEVVRFLIDREIREEEWAKEREVLRGEVADEMRPTLKAEAEERANRELREKLVEGIKADVRAENRRRMEESGFI